MLQHIGKKTTLRLTCPQMQVLTGILSCFRMINVTIFSVNHLVGMQRLQKNLIVCYLGLTFFKKDAQCLLFSLLSYLTSICSSFTAA
uniref:NDV infected-like protein n=1 Tax=Gallus gallus TaxID=9031 RepID=G3CUT1_CHICK|nr:NDV infected-like protein [Gallus gallus]